MQAAALAENQATPIDKGDETLQPQVAGSKPVAVDEDMETQDSNETTGTGKDDFKFKQRA